MTLKIERDSKLKASTNMVIVQLGLYALPIIAMPYIVKTVGVENCGKYFFFQSIMGLLNYIVDYGFAQSGVRHIAASKTLRTINFEYSQIFWVKFFTFLVAVFIGLLLFFFDKFSGEKILFSCSFLWLVVGLLDTFFVYQGIEKLKDYVNINLISSLVTFVLLFLIIRNEDDYIYLPVVYLAPRVLASFFLIYLLYHRFNIAPSYFVTSMIIKKFKKSFSVFVTSIFSVIYSKSPIVLLGFISGNLYVGYYSLADQLFSAYSNIQGRVSSVYQPQIAHGLKNNYHDGILKAKEALMVISILAIAGLVFTQTFAYDILFLLYKKNAEFSQLALKLLSFNFVIIQINSLLAVQILISFHKEKDLLKPSCFAAIISIFAGSVLIYYFQHIGAAISVVLIESFIFLCLFFKTLRYNFKLFSGDFLKRMFYYSMSVFAIATILKYLCLSVEIHIYIKFPIVVLFYGLSILPVIKMLKMVDFKERKILI